MLAEIMQILCQLGSNSGKMKTSKRKIFELPPLRNLLISAKPERSQKM